MSGASEERTFLSTTKKEDKIMKKRMIATVLTGILAMSLLGGCGSSSSSTADSAADAESSAEETTEAAAEETTEEAADEATSEETSAEAPACQDALKGVTLKIGTTGTYGPFSFFAEDGTTLQGYDVDLLNALQDILGFEVDGGTFQDMDYSPLGTSISQGQIDVAAAALCATDERKKSMNFSETYFDAGLKVIVAPDNDTITSVDDLKSGDYTVAVQSGTLAYEYATGEGALPESCLQVYDSQALAYKAVEDGQADATIYDVPGTAYSISTGEINLKMVGDEFYTGQAPYAIAFSFAICEEYPEIIDDFNAAIDYLTENGTMDELSAKWCE